MLTWTEGLMEKRIFFITRYSVLSQGKKKAWRIGRGSDNLDAYKKSLFDEERLNLHFGIFSQYVLPSIEGQSTGLGGITWLLLTSESLPDKAKRDLYSTLEHKPWIHVMELSPDENIEEAIKGFVEKRLQGISSCYATIRLDDDDLLAKDYLQALWKYVNKDFSGFTVTFPRGYVSRIDENTLRFTGTLSVRIPKTALGLAHIGYYGKSGILKNQREFQTKYASIYEVGDHTKVDQRTPLVADHSLAAYIRSSYTQQDTQDASFIKLKEKNPLVSKKVLLEYFDLNPSCFDAAHDPVGNQ